MAENNRLWQACALSITFGIGIGYLTTTLGNNMDDAHFREVDQAGNMQFFDYLEEDSNQSTDIFTSSEQCVEQDHSKTECRAILNGIFNVTQDKYAGVLYSSMEECQVNHLACEKKSYNDYIRPVVEAVQYLKYRPTDAVSLYSHKVEGQAIRADGKVFDISSPK
jgi:hypothetical protein